MRPVPEAHILLPRSDISQGQPHPTLVERIAELVVRHGDKDVPGYAYMPETRPVLKTRKKVLAFQKETMRVLLQYLGKNDPKALGVERYHHRQFCLKEDDLAFTLDTEGSDIPFHTDGDTHVYSSLCYWPL